jgi:hypothetical protein
MSSVEKLFSNLNVEEKFDIKQLEKRANKVCKSINTTKVVYYGGFVENPNDLKESIFSKLTEENIKYIESNECKEIFHHITFCFLNTSKKILLKLIKSEETNDILKGIQMLEKYENNLKLLEEFKKMKGDKLDVVITHIKITTNNMDKDNVLVLRVEPTEKSKEIFEKFSQNENPHITGLCFKKSNGKMTAPVYSNEALKDSVQGTNIKVNIPYTLMCDLFPN